MFTESKSFKKATWFSKTEEKTQPGSQTSKCVSLMDAQVATRRGASSKILAARFDQVRRHRDYCRVEAVVTVTFQYHPSLPPRTERLLTSVPCSCAQEAQDLRQRLIDSAMRLAVLMHRSDREGQLRAA
ncbi:hypothetical protein [Marinovum sp.]|uniref:hypothetical protein n=1 Tax=Marinovum sp. TaxID=2024839 RepID=UPI003A8CA348